LASRRKYRDGAALKADDVASVPEVGADVPLAPASPADSDDSVKRALEATLRAEEWQRQQGQQPPPPDAVIDAIPGISSRQRSFLKANPSLVLNDEHRRAATSAYQAALRSGVDADSEAMDEHMLEGVRRLHQHPIEAEPSMLPPIDRTADQPQSRRPSIPVSAPVSRDVPSPSGRRMSELRNITLSAAEREIARNSYGGGTPEEKEYSYALQKAKMLRMREQGTLNE
jgi:hypothetical protein